MYPIQEQAHGSPLLRRSAALHVQRNLGRAGAVSYRNRERDGGPLTTGEMMSHVGGSLDSKEAALVGRIVFSLRKPVRYFFSCAVPRSRHANA